MSLRLRRLRAQKGITMFDVTLSVAVGTALLVAALPQQLEKLEERQVEVSATQLFTIHDLAQQYRWEIGAWPGATGAPACNIADAMTDLVNEGYLAQALNTTAWASAITTTCTPEAFVVNTIAPSALRAQEAARLLPTATVTGATLSTRAPAGGTPNNLQVLHRVAIPGRPELNQMQTDLDLNTNDITNGGNITANRLTANTELVSVGTATIPRINGSTALCDDAAPACETRVAGNKAAIVTGAVGDPNVALNLRNAAALLRITAPSGNGLGNLEANQVRAPNGLRWANNSELTAAEGGSIELGGGGSDPANPAAVGRPFIDFHFTGSAEDYNLRLQNSASNTLAILAPGGVPAILDTRGDIKASENIRADQTLVAGTDVRVASMAKSMSQGVYSMTIAPPDSLIDIPTYCATLGLEPKIYLAPSNFAEGPLATPIYQVRTYADVEGSQWRIKMALLTENGVITNPPPAFNNLHVTVKCEVA